MLASGQSAEVADASINSAVDNLRGLKENVIVGRLIPAGTGMEYYRNIQLSPELEEVAARVQQEVQAQHETEEREREIMRQEGEAEEWPPSRSSRGRRTALQRNTNNQKGPAQAGPFAFRQTPQHRERSA